MRRQWIYLLLRSLLPRKINECKPERCVLELKVKIKTTHTHIYIYWRCGQLKRVLISHCIRTELISRIDFPGGWERGWLCNIRMEWVSTKGWRAGSREQARYNFDPQSIGWDLNAETFSILSKWKQRGMDLESGLLSFLLEKVPWEFFPKVSVIQLNHQLKLGLGTGMLGLDLFLLQGRVSTWFGQDQERPLDVLGNDHCWGKRV